MKLIPVLMIAVVMLSCGYEDQLTEDKIYDSFIGKDWNFAMNSLGTAQDVDDEHVTFIEYERECCGQEEDGRVVYSTIYGQDITFLKKYRKVTFWFNWIEDESHSSICKGWIGYK